MFDIFCNSYYYISYEEKDKKESKSGYLDKNRYYYGQSHFFGLGVSSSAYFYLRFKAHGGLSCYKHLLIVKPPRLAKARRGGFPLPTPTLLPFRVCLGFSLSC